MQNQEKKGGRQMNTNIIANPLETGTDELERLAFQEIVKRRRFGNAVNGLVLPSGNGELVIAMARLDCKVTAGDEAEQEKALRGRVLAAGLRDDVHFVPFSFAELPEDIAGEPFDLIFCRRSLCSLPYDQARKVVRQLLLRLKIGGKLFVSALGLHSELGDDYPGGEQLLEQRFSALSPAMSRKYEIHSPVCLYSERNLFSLLMDAGGSVLRTFTSTHGNVKGIAVRV